MARSPTDKANVLKMISRETSIEHPEFASTLIRRKFMPVKHPTAPVFCHIAYDTSGLRALAHEKTDPSCFAGRTCCHYAYDEGIMMFFITTGQISSRKKNIFVSTATQAANYNYEA
jgi:hypothetical protein